MRYRRGAAAVYAAIVVVLGGCSDQGTRPSAAPTPTPTPSPVVSPNDLSPYAGVYRTSTNVTYLITRSALLVDTNDDSVHSIRVAAPGTAAVGPSFDVSSPPTGTIAFPGWHPGQLAPSTMVLASSDATVIATRLPTTAEDVHISSGDVVLAATLTRPSGAGRLPAIAIVHGSGRETRAILDLWTQLYVNLGFAVLTYDKRGVGESTGTYPGDNALPSTFQAQADDAAAVVAYLRNRQDVDPAKVGLYGGSAGGWVVPLANRQAHPAFNILASGPPVTAGQQGVFAAFSGGGSYLPTESDIAIDAQVAADSSGYDPLPLLASDTVPTLWVFGAADRHVPTRLAVANLTQLNRPNFSWRVYPRCSHNLLDTGTGLDKDDATATRFGAGLFADIASFTQKQGVRPT